MSLISITLVSLGIRAIQEIVAPRVRQVLHELASRDESDEMAQFAANSWRRNLGFNVKSYLESKTYSQPEKDRLDVFGYNVRVSGWTGGCDTFVPMTDITDLKRYFKNNSGMREFFEQELQREVHKQRFTQN